MGQVTGHGTGTAPGTGAGPAHGLTGPAGWLHLSQETSAPAVCYQNVVTMHPSPSCEDLGQASGCRLGAGRDEQQSAEEF